MKVKFIIGGIFFCLLLVLTTLHTHRALAQIEPGLPYFVDVTDDANLFVPRLGEDRVTGQAWGDYDQDGWLDLYVTDDARRNILYHNEGNGTFIISTLSDSVALPDARSAGTSFADYDNDGWPDLFVANWGKNTLFHNEEGQRFVDVTDVAGVGDTANGRSGSWGDYDQDGYLDLYVANWSCYPDCGRPSEGDKDRLYHNNGDGSFTDVTNLLGGYTRGAGFVASFIDYDNDNDPDIYLINDEFITPTGNVLWRNDGPGCDGWCFTNVSAAAGVDTKVMGMGLATGDYDGDGDLDFYFSNSGPMVLLQNQGDGTFQDVTTAAGVAHPSGSWGTFFFDFDNDGWQDLYLGVMKGLSGNTSENVLFHNNGDGTFTDVTTNSGANDLGPTVGVAYADYDKDGWVDLVVGNAMGLYRLYRNQTERLYHNHWLTLKLVGEGAVNRDAVGARVYVQDSNGRIQMQEVINGGSIGAGNALELYFGLGKASIRQVRVQWPDGHNMELGPLPYNQRYQISYSSGASTIDTMHNVRSLTTSQTIMTMVTIVGLFVIGFMAYTAHRG